MMTTSNHAKNPNVKLVDGRRKRTFVNVLRYPGGKVDKADYLVDLFPDGICEYREPMVGGGSVYLAARTRGVAKSYWINDKFGHLYCFWLMCQKRCEKLHKILTETLSDCEKDADSFRALHHEAINAKKLTKFEAAYYFFILNRITFSGTVLAGGFSAKAALGRFTQSSIERLLKLPPLLEGTRITNEDYSVLLKEPGEDVFIFLDPPYDNNNSSKLYGNKGKLHKFDHVQLAKDLKNTNHKFLLTYRDVPEIRKLYSSWANIQTFQKVYGMTNPGKRKPGSDKKTIATELVISNYAP